MKQFDSSVVGQPYSRVMQILIREKELAAEAAANPTAEA